MTLTITLIGGPTALIEIDGFRLLTDPTFDGPGDYQLPHVKLEKLTGPAMSARDVGPIDAVLLSHDQHSDNLDHSGRDFLARSETRADDGSGSKAARRQDRGLCALGIDRVEEGRPVADRHRDAGPSWPGRHRAAVGRRHRLRGGIERGRQPRRSTSVATPPGSMASPRSRGDSRQAWCCRSRARRKPAARSISPWTPTTRSRPRAHSRMR